MKKTSKYNKYAIGGSYQGGPIGKHQWELPSSPNTPGYEDYGSMYYIPGGYGLYEKPRDYSKEYTGYGNPANLLSNQVYTPMNRPKAVNPYNTQDIMKKKAMRQMDTTGKYNNMYLQGEGSTSDYSIDALRQQSMANGGFMQKKGYFWNGHSMQKAKDGAYDTMWREGGQFQQVPVDQDMYRYGLNLYKDGGMVNVPVPQHMGRYGLMLYKGGGSVHPSYTAFQPNLNGMYKEGGIHIKPENKGKFTQWASAHGMGVQEAARHVMANKEDYSSTIVKRANFAKNAAGWKHQYGGSTMRRYANGGVTDENPIGGATTFTGQNPAGMSTTAPTQNRYDPATDPNNPVNQNIPMPQQGGYAASQGAVWDETGTTDGQPEEEQMTTDELTKQRRPIGTGYRNLLGAAMMYGNYAANQRQQKNLQAYGIQQGITQMKPTPNPWGKGVYNQQGQMMQPQGRYGGTMPQYAVGGEYHMTDDEIRRLTQAGYRLKMI